MPATIITFESVRLVIKADALLKQNQIICKIIPVPSHISSECGMCIETNSLNHDDIRRILLDHHIPHQINVDQPT